MTIRQAQLQADNRVAPSTDNPQVVLQVKKTRQLIGDTWYEPEIRITNLLESPITVMGVELAAQNGRYSRSSTNSQILPIEIPAGKTEVVHALFRLEENVRKTFGQPAELHVHYQTGGKDEIVRTTILGGHLND